MKFESRAGPNPTDRLKVLGQPVDRVDGPLKTTGAAPYAYERHDVAANQAYGYVLGSAIAKGRIAAMDLKDAKAASGVLAIVTAENAGKLNKASRNSVLLLGGPLIQHYHQAVAMVVAETFEQARTAANMIRIDYERADGQFDLAGSMDVAVKPGRGVADTAVGDFDGAFAAAPVRLDQTYTTPDQAHAMMEPFASIAAWNGDALTVWTSNQIIGWGHPDLAETLGMPKEKVRMDSPYVGGGFGGKLFLRADAVLAALGARAAKRPVKVSIHRALMYNNSVHRPATIQRIRIAAGHDGRITALGHESWSGNVPGSPYAEMAVQQSRTIYAGANRMTRTRLAPLDLPEGNAMRAPGEAPGLMALEIAIDEIAEKLSLDPVAFRILNDTKVMPESPERAFSQPMLVQCLRQGAERFGWSRRDPRPGSVREGNWLIGMGVAAGIRNSPTLKSGARVRLGRDGIVTVETDMTDIGTGSYTIIAQTAAEVMGLPLDKVVVRLGDSRFPVSSGSGGQFGAVSSTSGVYAACVRLREMVAQKLGLGDGPVDFTDGKVRSGSRTAPLGDAARDGDVVAEDSIEWGTELAKSFAMHTFAAHFVEAAVDVRTGETRVRRMLAVCSAGRILNPKSARSQVIGAMTMGTGAALMEDLVVDKRFGYFVNHDMAQYEVPVHADIPHQEVIFLGDADPVSSPMKARGVGELGLCGVGAAIANAIYNATGVRVRDYPMTLDKYLDRLPAAT